MRYIDKIGQNVTEGHGMILFGPVGSGKTHLASAVAKAAVKAGFAVAWRTGPEIFAAARAESETTMPRVKSGLGLVGRAGRAFRR